MLPRSSPSVEQQSSARPLENQSEDWLCRFHYGIESPSQNDISQNTILREETTQHNTSRSHESHPELPQNEMQHHEISRKNNKESSKANIILPAQQLHNIHAQSIDSEHVCHVSDSTPVLPATEYPSEMTACQMRSYPSIFEYGSTRPPQESYEPNTGRSFPMQIPFAQRNRVIRDHNQHQNPIWNSRSDSPGWPETRITSTRSICSPRQRFHCDGQSFGGSERSRMYSSQSRTSCDHEMSESGNRSSRPILKLYIHDLPNGQNLEELVYKISDVNNSRGSKCIELYLPELDDFPNVPCQQASVLLKGARH